jgi:hypothetical protein
MSDQNKKGNDQVAKRNPEEDVTWLFLEASLNMGVARLKLHEVQSGKNKVIDGVRNKLFLVHSNQQYKYYLGNFGIDKLAKEKIANNNDILPSGGPNDLKGQLNKNANRDTKISYKIYTGYVNWKNTWDISDIKEVITSSTPEINPTKNKSKAFRYVINTTDSNNKIGSLKQVDFEIFVSKRCCVCGVEDSPYNKLVYCQNDKNFFCSACDKTWHEQKEKMSLNLHLRTTNFKYTLTYFGNCPQPGHFNKPYQYFDEKNKCCLCVKCVEQFLNNPDKINKEIAFVEEYLKIKSIDEDFLNSRIDSICEEINHRLFYAEDVWKKIDKYEKEYCQELDDDKNENLKKMYDEGFARQTFLCCIFMEIQRIIKEIDSKIIFIKNQRNNVDVSTFIYMNQIYLLYMQKELIANLDYLCATNLEISAKNIITINDKDDKKFEPLKLEPFVDSNKDDYILNDIN